MVGGELGNTLSVLEIDRAGRRLTLGASASILPANYAAPGTTVAPLPQSANVTF